MMFGPGVPLRTLRAYVAGSSAPGEIARVDGVSSTLTAYGIEVISTWPSVVRAQGEGNPPDASRADRLAWSSRCLAEVVASDVVLFLVPDAITTRGAWVELGAAWSHHKYLVCAGATSASVFCAIAQEFGSDLDAIAHIVAIARRRT